MEAFQKFPVSSGFRFNNLELEVIEIIRLPRSPSTRDAVISGPWAAPCYIYHPVMPMNLINQLYTSENITK
jgi:hypothetical protein